MASADAAEVIELRILDGPNLYFTRPAVKLTLRLRAWMEMPAGEAGRRAARLKVPAASVGPPLSQQRNRFLARLSAQAVRRLAEAGGSRLAVRGRVGPELGQVVVAFPWRRRSAAEALVKETARLLDACLLDRRPMPRLLQEAAERLDRTDSGDPPVLPVPAIPVVAVTGTNGKTTTVRLVAHLGRTAGRSVAYTTTDGVYRDGELVLQGDYSGFSGAATALAQEGIDMAVLEIARGGILLRGIGTTHNDVAVVTNVSEDHLDQYGIRTLDQLAEVKATITRITRPEGWDVLNADDPRVLAMRRSARGRVWLCSLDHDHPAIRETLRDGGRAITVIDGELVVLERGQAGRRLLPVAAIPATLSGIASQHVRNAMAAAAAALAAGIPWTAVASGLKTFGLDPQQNPGRANLFELDGRLLVVDYAHNEEGMKGLIEICQGLRPPGRSIWLTFGSAGDRTNSIIHRLAYTAARGADRIAINELRHYLRGRDPDDLMRRLLAGAADGGARDVRTFPDEMHALGWMLESSSPGDVVAVAALGQRPEVFAFLEERGARPVRPDRVAELVRAAAPS
jgi:cyanophycin synthetase